MRILVDISHPAHAHFYRHMHGEFLSRGHDVLVVARDKEVTLDLLEQFGIPARSVGRSGHKSFVGQAAELIRRDSALVSECLRFRPHVLLTRNPSGAQAARVVPGVRGVFDTDDGPAVGLHWKLAAPFAHVITTPQCLRGRFGRKHVTYPSFKALAYLHPDRFSPDPNIRDQLGLGPTESYALVRLVALDASHDRSISGLSARGRRAAISALERNVSVFVSSEVPLEGDMRRYQPPLPASAIHDLIASAEVVVGDSQTVTAEAAVLGTPALHCSTFSGRVDYLVELEQRYGLVASFPPDEEDRLLERLARFDDLRAWKEEAIHARARLLAESVDLTAWYVDFVTAMGDD